VSVKVLHKDSVAEVRKLERQRAVRPAGYVITIFRNAQNEPAQDVTVYIDTDGGMTVLKPSVQLVESNVDVIRHYLRLIGQTRLSGELFPMSPQERLIELINDALNGA
jgi:hypothetical protein